MVSIVPSLLLPLLHAANVVRPAIIPLTVRKTLIAGSPACIAKLYLVPFQR